MSGEWLALVESDGRAYLLQRGAGEVHIKKLNQFNINNTVKNAQQNQYAHGNLLLVQRDLQMEVLVVVCIMEELVVVQVQDILIHA